jgi:hypothetical protein
MTGTAAGRLSARLVEFCDRIGDPALDPIRARLADPGVRVAVAISLPAASQA